MFIRYFLLPICIFSAIALSAEEKAIEIFSDYPGGNIIVENIDQATCTANIRQDLRDTSPWWFYWNFKAKNIGGKTVTFKFTNKPKPWNLMETYGPAVSIDGGKTWKWLNPPEPRGRNRFVYTTPEGVNEAQFAFCIPYTFKDFEAFAQEMNGKNGFSLKPLCKTREGRQNVCVELNENPSKKKARVFLTARHHACESTGSYVLEGFMRELFSDSPEGKALREKAEFFIIPMIDLDGVENGDQGKSRTPHDHNRDYSDKPIYPSVAASREKLLKWESEGGTDFIMDFHSPSVGAKLKDGKNFSEHNVISLVGQENPAVAREQMRFSKILEDINDSPLPFRASDFLPHGKLWNQGSYTTSLSNFGASLNGTKLSSSLETPYSCCRGIETSPEKFKAFGRCVAKALLQYLNSQVKE